MEAILKKEKEKNMNYKKAVRNAYSFFVIYFS